LLEIECSYEFGTSEAQQWPKTLKCIIFQINPATNVSALLLQPSEMGVHAKNKVGEIWPL
jgi:hypothetical protein